MRNQRALAAACTAVAVLGLAAPVAVADGMGNGGGTTGGTGTGTIAGPGTGTIVGPGTGVGNFGIGGGGGNIGNGNGNLGIGGGGGGGGNIGNGNGNFGNGNLGGNGGFSGNGRFEGHFNGTISGNGRISSNGRGDDNGRGGNLRGDEFGNRRGDDFGPDDNGLGGDLGGPGDHFDGLHDIVVTPRVVAAGGRLTVTVQGCRRGGEMASHAFRTAPLTPLHDDTSRGAVYVNRNARAGRYDIFVRCGGPIVTRSRAFTVIGSVDGGLGGSRTIGATTADMAIGGGLVGLALIGGGAYWLRRRGERRA
ncbi:hypothetical protein [Streptomyces sp. NPDC001056]